MNATVLLFWASLSILFFCYAGYGFVLFVWNSVSRKQVAIKSVGDKDLPAVTLIIAAYNEEEVLQEKILNSLAILYPAGKFKILIITDGSTDRSREIVAKFPEIIGMHLPERSGKSAAINRAMQKVDSPIVVFSDANTMLNPECLERIVVHYLNPKTGGVAGEKKINKAPRRSAVGDAEGLYWQYESFLKRQDALLHTVVGAAGELFSIRTSLFKPLDEKIILDDFVLSMQVCLQGYNIEYEPQAFATESPSMSLAEESKRKIRISAGAYQSIGYLKKCLNPFNDPVLTFQYVSRRLLRWVFCPLMLITLLLSNIILFYMGDRDGFYAWFLYAQLFFYLIAIVGGLLIRAGKSIPILTIPFYFLFMNYCLVRGFLGFMMGTQSVLWERSVRMRG